MPDLQEIIAGKPVQVPREVDLQYAVATALVGHAIRARDTEGEDQVYGNILNFASQFPEREMGVMMVSDMTRAIGDKIFGLPEFTDWSDAVADMMIFGN